VAESDLERRVARLERGVRLAVERAGRVATGIEKTRGAVLVRRPPLPPVPGPGSGEAPCCPGRPAPSTLNVRGPSGEVGTLTYSSGTRNWSGSLTIDNCQVREAYIDALGRCLYNAMQVPIGGSYTFDLLFQCASGATPGAIHLLTGIGRVASDSRFPNAQGSRWIVRPGNLPAPPACYIAAFTASASPSPGQCDPFNLVLTGSAVVGGVLFPGPFPTFLVYE
jgi:hypothetical protein